MQITTRITLKLETEAGAQELNLTPEEAKGLHAKLGEIIGANETAPKLTLPRVDPGMLRPPYPVSCTLSNGQPIRREG